MPLFAARKHFPTFLRWAHQGGPAAAGLLALAGGLWGGQQLALGLWALGPGLEAEAVRRLGDRLAPHWDAQRRQAFATRDALLRRLGEAPASPGQWPQALAQEPNVAQAWELWPDGRLWQAEAGRPARFWTCAPHLPEAEAMASAAGPSGPAPWALGAWWVPAWPHFTPRRHPLEAIPVARRAQPPALPGEGPVAIMAKRVGPGPLRALRLKPEAFLPSLAERQASFERLGLAGLVDPEWAPGSGLVVAGPRVEWLRSWHEGGLDWPEPLLWALVWGESPWREWRLGTGWLDERVPFVGARHHRPTEAGLRWVRGQVVGTALLPGLGAWALAQLLGLWAWARWQRTRKPRRPKVVPLRRGALWRLGLGLLAGASLAPLGLGLMGLGLLEGLGPWGVVRAHQEAAQGTYQTLALWRRERLEGIAKAMTQLPPQVGEAWLALAKRPEVIVAVAFDARGQAQILTRRWRGHGQPPWVRWEPALVGGAPSAQLDQGAQASPHVQGHRRLLLAAHHAELLAQVHEAHIAVASPATPSVGVEDAVWRGSLSELKPELWSKALQQPHLVWRRSDGSPRLYLRFREDAYLKPPDLDAAALGQLLAKHGLDEFEADPLAELDPDTGGAGVAALVRLGWLAPPLLRPTWANGVPRALADPALGLKPKDGVRAWPGLVDRLLAGLLVLVLAGLALRQVGQAVRQLAKEGAEDFAGGALAAGVAHELRTPLTALKLDAELLASGLVPTEGQGAIAQRLAQQVGRLERRLDDVMAWGRLASGHGRAATEPYAPLAVAEQALEEAEALLALRGLKAELQGEAPAGPWYGDPAALRRALVELLANAAKHGAGPIVLQLEAEGWAVRDHGPGLGARERKKAFLAFERLGATAQGAGLGLALVQAVAIAHGGQAWAEAAEGGGLCVRLRVAAQPE